MSNKTMRIVATHPTIGVPYPGQPHNKLRGQPRTVRRTPYWERYLSMGIVLEVAALPQAATEVTAIARVEE